jgi:molybdopterin molybdotransferase
VKPVKLTPVHEALAVLLNAAQPLSDSETIPLPHAAGRVLAASVTASMAVPAFDNSAMDGYAVNTADCTAVGAQLPVVGTIAAGHPMLTLAPHAAARIFTGAPIPAGANAVVMQENVQRVGADIVLNQVPALGENIRRAGHDIALGAEVLPAGQVLQPQDLGLLASLGFTTLTVQRRLRVAILNTGDEVVAPGSALQAGQLYDSNSFTLAALLEGMGAQVIKLGIVADSLAATASALAAAAKQADCVISTGGVSVGEADFVKAAVEQLGHLALWKLAIKPGKPFSFGSVAGVPFFGLPGNPVAVFITFIALVKPYLRKLQGCTGAEPLPMRVQAGFALSEPGSRQEYLRVRLRQPVAGLPVAELYPDQSSSVLTSLSWADGVVVVPVQTTVAPGQLVEYLPFRGAL